MTAIIAKTTTLLILIICKHFKILKKRTILLNDVRKHKFAFNRCPVTLRKYQTFMFDGYHTMSNGYWKVPDILSDAPNFLISIPVCS